MSLPNTSDPYKILNLSEPTADVTVIKRAYKRMALRYHPDVVTNSDSTPEERKKANDDFAKINAAYEMLSGKGGGGAGVGVGGGGGVGKTGSGYQPPHRRSKAPSSSTGRASTNWEDYMPKYDEEDAKYDAGGDSFEKIFQDIIMGAAGAAAGYSSSGKGGGGILKDLIEFLEDNVEGLSSGQYDSDPSLNELLSYGTFDDVANEMDDADLLVKSLERKMDDIEKELINVKAEVKVSDLKFSERLDLESRMAELEARKEVAGGYLKKARKRLVKLQTRYKELIVQGEGGGGLGDHTYRSSSSGAARSSSSSSAGPYAGGRSASSSARPSSSAGPSSSSYRSPPSSGVGSSTTSSSSVGDDAKGRKESWKTEGFGSYGHRGRSSGRRRSRRGGSRTGEAEGRESSGRAAGDRSSSSSTTTAPREAASSRTAPPPPRQPSPRTTATTSEEEDWAPPIPPHRRTKSAASKAASDKKRLREIRVDEEFDKLKKDLGL